MIYLNDKIVAYLTVNQIAFAPGNFKTAQPAGEPDQIVYWDDSILGAQPDDTTLAAAPALLAAQQEAAALAAMTCTRSQFKLAAYELGILDQIESVVAGCGDREIQIRWAEAPTFYRNFPGWDAMVAQIGKTQADVTELFRLAQTK